MWEQRYIIKNKMISSFGKQWCLLAWSAMSILTNQELQSQMAADKKCFGEETNLYAILYVKMLANVSDISTYTRSSSVVNWGQKKNHGKNFILTLWHLKYTHHAVWCSKLPMSGITDGHLIPAWKKKKRVISACNKNVNMGYR